MGARLVRDHVGADAAAHGPIRIDQRFEPYPGIHFDEETYSGDAYPAYGWASAVAEVDVDLDTKLVVVAGEAADAGKLPPPLAEGGAERGSRLRSPNGRGRAWLRPSG